MRELMFLVAMLVLGTACVLLGFGLMYYPFPFLAKLPGVLTYLATIYAIGVLIAVGALWYRVAWSIYRVIFR